MTTINATLLKTVVNDTSIPDATMVILIQDGIDKLNAYGAGLSDLTAGALVATSAQAGAITAMVKEVYKIWSNAGGVTTTGVGGLSISYSGDVQLLTIAQKLANQLIGKSFKRA